MKLPRIRLFRKRGIWARNDLQIFFFALIAFISINHTLVRDGGGISFLSSASLHALCPFGGVETMFQLLTTGDLIQQVRASSIILLDLTLLLSLLLGPVFCGWVCPLGTIQEWVGKLGRKWFGNKMYNQFIPRKLDRVLRYLRYGVLAWVLYVTFASAKLVFQSYDPYFALFNFWTGEVTITAILILESILLLSLLVERPWCKYACPFGALLGISNLFCLFTIRREAGACKFKGEACSTLCPMNIEISKHTVIRDHQCITCMECTSEACCPAKGVVYLGLGGME